MKQIIQGFKKIIRYPDGGAGGQLKTAFERVTLDKTHNTFGIIRQSP